MKLQIILATGAALIAGCLAGPNPFDGPRYTGLAMPKQYTGPRTERAEDAKQKSGAGILVYAGAAVAVIAIAVAGAAVYVYTGRQTKEDFVARQLKTVGEAPLSTKWTSLYTNTHLAPELQNPLATLQEKAGIEKTKEVLEKLVTEQYTAEELVKGLQNYAGISITTQDFYEYVANPNNLNVDLPDYYAVLRMQRTKAAVDKAIGAIQTAIDNKDQYIAGVPPRIMESIYNQTMKAVDRIRKDMTPELLARMEKLEPRMSRPASLEAGKAILNEHLNHLHTEALSAGTRIRETLSMDSEYLDNEVFTHTGFSMKKAVETIRQLQKQATGAVGDAWDKSTKWVSDLFANPSATIPPAANPSATIPPAANLPAEIPPAANLSAAIPPAANLTAAIPRSNSTAYPSIPHPIIEYLNSKIRVDPKLTTLPIPGSDAIGMAVASPNPKAVPMPETALQVFESNVRQAPPSGLAPMPDSKAYDQKMLEEKDDLPLFISKTVFASSQRPYWYTNIYNYGISVDIYAIEIFSGMATLVWGSFFMGYSSYLH